MSIQSAALSHQTFTALTPIFSPLPPLPSTSQDRVRRDFETTVAIAALALQQVLSGNGGSLDMELTEDEGEYARVGAAGGAETTGRESVR